MSRSLAMNSGSRASLKVLTRCGTSPCAFQIPCTAPRLMPTALALARPVQWVASPGGASRVNSTTRSTVASDRRGVPGGRVLSRRSPATPSAMNRSCQRQTHGLDLPVRCMIVLVPRSSAVARMISARQTCFCGLLRSAITASRRARSAAKTSTVIPLRIRLTWRPHAEWEPSVSVSPLVIDPWVGALPTLDLWLHVETGEMHHVRDLIPTLDWEAGRLGVRSRYEPKDIALLYKDFLAAITDAKTMRAAAVAAVAAEYPNADPPPEPPKL